MSEMTQKQLLAATLVDKVYERIKQIDSELEHYKLGDVYILEYMATQWDPTVSYETVSHLGTNAKYKCVHVSSAGIPFFRKLNAGGKPTGMAFTPNVVENLTGTVNYDAWDNDDWQLLDDYQRFVPDPDQLNAILLDEEYNPNGEASVKAKLFNEINRYNKSITIKTNGWNGNPQLRDFMQALKPGDTFYMGKAKAYVVQSTHIGRPAWTVTAKDQSGKEVVFDMNGLSYKRLYKSKPRSFADENKS